MPNTTTVLLTAGYGPAAQSIIYGLRQQSEIPVRIVCTDANSDHLRLADPLGYVGYHIPRASDESYERTMLDIVTRERPTLLIPMLDAELKKISRMRKELEKLGCRLYLTNPEFLEVALDKRKLYAKCATRGIPHPQFKDCKLTFPAFIKPACGVGSANTHIITDLAELEYWTHALGEYVVQPYITGKEFTIDLVMIGSVVYGSVVRERIETKGGVAIHSRITVDTELEAFAHEIAREFQVEGICNIQCFRETGTGEVLFSEINMRPAGASILSIRSGFNTPLVLLRHALGMRVTPIPTTDIEPLSMIGHFEPFFY